VTAVQIDPGNDLLDLALRAHGGLERWQELETLTATFTLGGALFGMKGKPDGLGGAVVATVDTMRPQLSFSPFMGATRGVFEPDRVTIAAEDGSERELNDPRARCLDVAAEDPWDDLHILYFSGYALWNYLATPFMFRRPGFSFEEVEPWHEGEHTWRGLRVAFPEDVPTHTREQVFYFDEAGLLRRLDYAVDILGSPAPVAAHLTDEHDEFSGLVVPTRRRVYLRDEDGVPNTEAAVVELDISDVTVG
jgi:hypothetical protein